MPRLRFLAVRDLDASLGRPAAEPGAATAPGARLTDSKEFGAFADQILMEAADPVGRPRQHEIIQAFGARQHNVYYRT